MNDGPVQSPLEKASLIEVDESEEENENIILSPNQEKIVTGFYTFTLNQGSFEMSSAFDEKPVKINRGLVETLCVSIRAGERGCALTLIRKNQQKKF
jgi:hypothetical protein